MTKRNTFTELDYEILQTLIEFMSQNAKEPKTITYKELVARVDNPAVIPVNMGSHLGRIGEVINATANLTHAPIPNSLVVSKSTDKAGVGYDEMMQSMHKNEPTVQAIYDYEKWDLVLDIAKSNIGKLI